MVAKNKQQLFVRGVAQLAARHVRDVEVQGFFKLYRDRFGTRRFLSNFNLKAQHFEVQCFIYTFAND